ncbi:epoxide hydrolase N-terminal domain-containing protein, partial [Klebsiella pneumoniae]|uniref:epoxide hydrolase N-terminal domain-containing protein n=1 Tax=Klebsiella pneumoniae TaxID=573 RepID=UPI003CF7746F
ALMTDAVEPHVLTTGDAAMADLHRRIDATRWPERETVDGWEQGVPLAALQDFVHTWRHEYDWRPTERWINDQGLFTTTIDG